MKGQPVRKLDRGLLIMLALMIGLGAYCLDWSDDDELGDKPSATHTSTPKGKSDPIPSLEFDSGAKANGDGRTRSRLIPEEDRDLPEEAVEEIRVKVMAELSGDPIPGAEICLYLALRNTQRLEGGRLFRKRLATAKTDQAGCGSFPGPFAQVDHIVLAVAPGWGTTYIKVDWQKGAKPGAGFGPVELLMGPALELHGRVIDADTSSPIAGIEVNVSGFLLPFQEHLKRFGDTSGCLLLSTLSKKDGTFRIKGVDPRLEWRSGSSGGRKIWPFFLKGFTYYLELTTRLYEQNRAKSTVLSLGGGELLVRLKRIPGYRIKPVLPTGGVWHESTRLILSIFNSIRRKDGSSTRSINACSTRTVPYSPGATLSFGHKSRSKKGKFELLAVAHDSKGPYSYGWSERVLPRPERALVPIPMKPVASWLGLVVDRGGQPISKVRIKGANVGALSMNLGDRDWVTDGHGKFTLWGIPGRQRVVLLEKEGYAHQSVKVVFQGGNAFMPIQAVLSKQGGVIAGRLVDREGKPVPLAQIIVDFCDLTSFIDCAQYKAITDASGRFRCEKLPYGNFKVWVTRPHWLYGGQLPVQLSPHDPARLGLELRLK